MKYDLSRQTAKDAFEFIDSVLSAIDECCSGNRKESEPEKRTSYDRDAILDACRKYCEAHECVSCKVGKQIEEHHSEDDWCIICSIASCEQPVEAMLAEVMRYAREGDPKPKSYVEHYFEYHPEAKASAIEKNGVKMPALCRALVYDGKDVCPGGKTCWECWQEIMEDN